MFCAQRCKAAQFLSSINEETKETIRGKVDVGRKDRWTNTTPRFYFSPRSPPPKPVRQEKREEEEETRGGSDEGEEENEEFSKDTRGSMTAIGASCLWKSTISMDSDTIDDNDPLLTKERLGAVRNS